MGESEVIRLSKGVAFVADNVENGSVESNIKSIAYNAHRNSILIRYYTGDPLLISRIGDHVFDNEEVSYTLEKLCCLEANQLKDIGCIKVVSTFVAPSFIY